MMISLVPYGTVYYHQLETNQTLNQTVPSEWSPICGTWCKIRDGQVPVLGYRRSFLYSTGR